MPRIAGGPLNEQQVLFARNFVVHGNGKRAAIEAGYARDSAAVQAYRLLRIPELTRLITEMRAQGLVAISMDTMQIAQEIYALAQQARQTGELGVAHKCLATLFDWSKEINRQDDDDKQTRAAHRSDNQALIRESKMKVLNLQANVRGEKAANVN